MKYLLPLVLTLFSMLPGYSQGFSVEQYTVDIQINAEGYFDVVERYDLNFDQFKHGIFRDIQTSYTIETSEGIQEKREIKISRIEVPGHKFEVSNAFTRKLEGKARIKIGDANKTVIGKQHYEIRYRVTNAFFYEEEGTKFYWNLKPTDWWAVFKSINFTIQLPENTDVRAQDCFIYSGVVGTTTPSNDFDLDFSDGRFSGYSRPDVLSNFGESVTVLVNLPPGSVKVIEPLWPFWSKYGWGFIVGALVFGFYMIWLKFGKDTRVTTTTSYYPPEGMDPAMAGFLINDREDTSDLISLIPYWGANGYIRMEEIDKKGWFAKDDTRIIKLKNLPTDAPDYQKKIFNGLFSGASHSEVLVSSLKDSFYTTMSASKSLLNASAQRYYEPKSRSVRKISGCLLSVLTVLLVPVLLYFWGWVAAAAMLVCGIVLLILNIFMIKKNSRGNMVLSELKGFREFIKTAELNKLKMLIAESPVYFESTMGYALAFGTFDSWARKFEALNIKPPDWYSTSNPGHYNMHSFSNSFSGSISSAQSTMVSSPSSSGSGGGGGSSGGGFGGGGGGSW
jgi:uncharacterized membrane protein